MEISSILSQACWSVKRLAETCFSSSTPLTELPGSPHCARRENCRQRGGQACWGQSFTYDGTFYTNLQAITSTKCTSQALNLTITNKNRFSGANVTFDDAGNLTNDGAGSTYTWNAENQLTSAAAVNYTYDGDGQRVKKDSGRLYWNSTGGQLLAETDLNGSLITEYVYFQGQLVARREAGGTVYYFFRDHLGSLRTITNAAGGVTRDSDYYPFGTER